MDADQFITELALDILDGRSFDISGRKCRYQQLFPAFDFLENEEEGSGGEEEEESPHIRGQETAPHEEEEEGETALPELEVVPIKAPVKRKAARPAAAKEVEKAKVAPVQQAEDEEDATGFVQRVLLKQLELEYQRLLRLQVRNFKLFAAKKQLASKGADMTMTKAQKHIYRVKMRQKIDAFSRNILASIQELQNQFEDVKRLERVTESLERLSEAINFDDH